MKQVLLALLVALLSTPVFATSNQDHTCQGGHNCNGNDIPPQSGGDQSQEQGQAQSQNQGQVQGQYQEANANAAASASVSSRNENTNTNVAIGGEGGKGGAGGNAYSEGGVGIGIGGSQGQSQSSNNSNSSNNSSSQSTSLTFEGTGEAKHANKYGNNVSAYAPAIYSSSACTSGGFSAGAAAFGMGISMGGAKQDAQCQVRENARILGGYSADLALIYLCSNPLVDIGAVLGAQCKPAPLPPVVVVPEEPTPEVPVVVVDKDVKG